MSNTHIYGETRWPWKTLVYSGVACDSRDRVYIIRRTHLPAILVFDSQGSGGLTPDMLAVLIFCVITFTLLYFTVLVFRLRLQRASEQLEALKRQQEGR